MTHHNYTFLFSKASLLVISATFLLYGFIVLTIVLSVHFNILFYNFFDLTMFVVFYVKRAKV